MTGLDFDSRGAASLDGPWDFYPGAHALAELDGLAPEPIRVPGLWEAQGHLDLDGEAWYRRRFEVEDASGGWTICFGAVMDMAEVFLNGTRLGAHDLAFTPFEVDAAAALVGGTNDLAVRVTDPGLADPDHPRMAHGKQGWANHVFPSRPSLYMTYGGIWQPVTIRRHGPLVLGDVFVNGDPDDLLMTADVVNRGPAPASARVAFSTLGRTQEVEVTVPAGGRVTAQTSFGAVGAAPWHPQDPALHHLGVHVWTGGSPSDATTVRYGLRTVRFEGRRLLINDEPYRMKSVLVQGFTARALYAEGTTDEIRAEVEAAKAMGFNTLRLHIKAFDPRYLDVCDEVGVFLHCDIPVAEPVLHEEMGGDTFLTQRCVAAARAQVRRDRNHPSIVLWSAMNEICDGKREARQWPQYESFARQLYAAVRTEDPTRPVIENDWIEPDPEEVFESPIITAHWYGRLHRDYLDKIEETSARWAEEEKPLFVTEFGDWGLPEMPPLAQPPFWDTRDVYAASLADTLWPATVGRFLIETQRYQGLSDRMQAEVFRRSDGIGGYCLTELTDVPIELNGLLDLHRRPKRIAVAEMTRANQVVLPMLRLESLVAEAGEVIRAELHVANDGPSLSDVTAECRFGDSVSAVSDCRLGDLAGYTATPCGPVTVVAPEVPGSHDLVVRLSAGGVEVAENRYPVHVVRVEPVPVAVQALGGGEELLAAVGATSPSDGAGPVVVAEGALDAGIGEQVRRRLEDGHAVLLLAQHRDAADHFPVATRLDELATAWGSTVFSFTTDHGALPALPRRNVLAAEDSTINATSVVAEIEGRRFPDTPVVIAYKPVPNAVTGTVIGAHAVGRGRLVFCQYRLARRVLDGDPAARAILCDLLRWVTTPRPVMTRRGLSTPDGRPVIAYGWHPDVAR